MHNIDVVQRILEYFLMHEQQQQQKSGKLISKILDSYLAEVARDPNLQITKFQVLAETLPENARTCHDGIYRAIDTYLKVLYKLPFYRYTSFLPITQICRSLNYLISPTVTSFFVRIREKKTMQNNGL